MPLEPHWLEYLIFGVAIAVTHYFHLLDDGAPSARPLTLFQQLRTTRIANVNCEIVVKRNSFDCFMIIFRNIILFSKRCPNGVRAD